MLRITLGLLKNINNLLAVVVVGFRDVVSYELARRGVRRGAAKASSMRA